MYRRRAILSDIHANLEALQAVLADMHTQAIGEAYCLGDIVGYGPDPVACLALAMEFDVCLLGNWDEALFDESRELSAGGRASLRWTQRQLAKDPDYTRLIAFLRKLPQLHRDDDDLYVHGSVRDPVHEYIFPEDVFNRRKMEAVFAAMPRHCFCGHTHVPGVLTESLEFKTPEELGDRYRLSREKAIINVGSVGQPRDGDPRACYVILVGPEVTFRRVDYDFQRATGKLRNLDF